MANEIWQQEEQKFLKAIQDVRIPNEKLEEVPFIIPHSKEDFEQIPASGGCYWIWTNEPVLHSLHKNDTPAPFDRGEIIYNGIAKDNVRGRIMHHLIGEVDAGWSGVSLDIHQGTTISHRKKAMSTVKRSKVPFIDQNPIRELSQLLQINLSDAERNFIRNNNLATYYFRNGINIFDEKHRNNLFRVYFITGLRSLFLDFIEKKWREDNNWLPKLCSYSSGR